MAELIWTEPDAREWRWDPAGRPNQAVLKPLSCGAGLSEPWPEADRVRQTEARLLLSPASEE